MLAEEISALEGTKNRLQQIVGFAVVLDPLSSHQVLAGQKPAQRMIASFLGPFGLPAMGACGDGYDWAMTLPSPAGTLSTWSLHQCTEGVCLIEGELYAKVWGYRPQAERDPCLARLLWENIESDGLANALAVLNGTFCGFALWLNPLRVACFVDTAGVRTLFWRNDNGQILITNNLFGLRGSGSQFKVDPLSLCEHLVLGQPIGSKTVFREIYQIPPGSVLVADKHAINKFRYVRFPPQEKSWSLRDASEAICRSLEQHINHVRTGDKPTAIALSGGKDSRVVLSTLLHEGKYPRAYSFHHLGEPRDSIYVQTLCNLAQVPLEIVPTDRVEQSLFLFREVSTLLHGLSGSWRFLALACAASLREDVIFTGYMGEATAGDFSGFQPWAFQTADRLAAKWFQEQHKAVNPEWVILGLRPDLTVPLGEIVEDVAKYYRALQTELGDLTAAFRIDMFENHRLSSVFQLMRSLITPVHPLADRDVIQTYLQIPIPFLLERKAQVAAAMLRYPEFGNVPTSPSGLPLRFERFAHPAFQIYRAIRRWIQRHDHRSIQRNTYHASKRTAMEMPERSRRLLSILEESSLFRTDVLEMSTPALATGRLPGLNKLAATSMFVAQILNQKIPAAPPPFFFSMDEPE